MNAKVQIGAELLCKGGKVDTGRDSTACYPRGIEAARLARSANPTSIQSQPYLYSEKLSPQEQLALALGLENLKPPPIILSE